MCKRKELSGANKVLSQAFPAGGDFLKNWKCSQKKTSKTKIKQEELTSKRMLS